MTPIKEWCQKRKIGTTFAYDLLKQKRLYAVKLGRKTYITDEEDQRFISALPAYKAERVGA